MTEHPDDTEINRIIAEAETFAEAIWEIATKYEVKLTNNEPRWQDGVYLRHIGDFTEDIRDAVLKFFGARDPVWFEYGWAADARSTTFYESKEEAEEFIGEPKLFRRRAAGNWVPND